MTDLAIVDLPPETTTNFGSVVEQVVTALDGAPQGALSGLTLAELVKGYKHIPETDFSRLRRVVPQLRSASPGEILEWWAGQALVALERDTPGLVLEELGDGRYVLRNGTGAPLTDLRWRGRLVRPRVQRPNRLGDPFNAKRADRPWVDDIRSKGAIAKDDLTELRQSMEVNGWLDDPIFDALVDEHGVVLVGHRRLRVAAELGIDASGHTREVDCGHGDDGDIKRLTLAVVSNIGRREMSKGDRQAIVKVLAGPDHDWSQMSIAAALGVSQQRISEDIAELRRRQDLPIDGKSGQGKQQRKERKPQLSILDKKPELREELIARERKLRAGEHVERQGEVAKRHGVAQSTISAALGEVRARLDAEDQAARAAELAVAEAARAAEERAAEAARLAIERAETEADEAAFEERVELTWAGTQLGGHVCPMCHGTGKVTTH